MINRFRLVLLIALCLGSVRGGFNDKCGAFQYYNASFDKNDVPPSIKSALIQVDEYLETLTANLEAPSLSFGVVYDQQIIHYKSVGFTDVESMKKPTPDSIYRIGSISKVWTVLMVFALRDQGVISMDNPISKLNPSFSIDNPWGVTDEERKGKTLTIKQLASQVSGLPRETPCTLSTQDCVNVVTEEIFERLSQQALVHPTDVQPSYSNLAYAILGNVLAEHQNYTSFTHSLFDLIITPLGLNHTGLYLSEEQKSHAATGYQPDGTQADYIDIGWEGPAGQLFSSVNDLAALMKQFFAAYPSLFQQGIDGNFVIAPQTLREMLRPVFMNTDQQTGFGSPWELQWVDRHLVRSKGGNIDGFSSQISMVPEMKLGVVALINYEVDEMQFALRALQLLIPAFQGWMEEMQSAQYRPSLPDNVNDFVGLYDLDGMALFNVSLDEKAENLQIDVPLAGISGWLVWNGGEDAFVYHDRFPHLDMCWDITLGALDSNTVRFERNKNGNVKSLAVDGLLYGLHFDKEIKGKAALMKGLRGGVTNPLHLLEQHPKLSFSTTTRIVGRIKN